MPDVCTGTMTYWTRLTIVPYRCVAVKTLPLNTDVEIECIALQ